MIIKSLPSTGNKCFTTRAARFRIFFLTLHIQFDALLNVYQIYPVRVEIFLSVNIVFLLG